MRPLSLLLLLLTAPALAQVPEPAVPPATAPRSGRRAAGHPAAPGPGGRAGPRARAAGGRHRGGPGTAPAAAD